MKSNLLFFLIFTLLLATLPVAAQNETNNGHEVRGRQAILKIAASSAVILDQIKQLGDADDFRPLSAALNLYVLHSKSENVTGLLNSLKNHPSVIYVEPDYVVKTSVTPNDPGFPQQWSLLNTATPGADIGATNAWTISTGSTTNVVGVVDTGMDYTHPDLAANVWSAPATFTVNLSWGSITCPAGSHGYNAITRSCTPLDDNGHGTHVSGTIGAVGNNATGVAGVNWTTRIMALKFLDSTGSGAVSDAIDGIEFALQAKTIFGSAANLRVFSNSWGGSGFSQGLLDEINKVNAANALFVVAAGNSTQNDDTTPTYPASYVAPNLITVAATTSTDTLASFSNYGPTTVHLGAPGVSILSTWPNSQYANLSGTSMATPHVSGAAMLVLSACNLSTAALKNAILANVDPLASLAGITVTGGRLDVNKAIRSCAGGSSSSSIRVNAGGPAYTDPQGQVWSADVGFTGGTTYSTGASIANTTTPALYQSERNGNMQYQFAVPNGSYTVTLKFAEIYFSSVGQRVFNVSINGTAVLTNFDIVAQAGGGFIALDRTFSVSVTSGQIAIQFTSVINNAKISAIQILPSTGISVGVTPATATLSAGQTQQFTASVSGTSNTAVNWSISPNVGTVLSTGLYTAPSSITATQNVTVTATSARDPTQSASATVTLQPLSTSFTTIRVNAGGPAYTDPQGQVWSADVGFTGGTTYSTGASIANTTTPALYQSERYGNMRYQFAVPNGSYTVTLKFAEIYFSSVGQRVFNVSINGTAVLTNFDIVAQAGGRFIALDRTFPVSVTSGQMAIQFSNVIDNAKISAIQIATAAPAFTPVRVNAGGAVYTDPQGLVWAADSGFNGGFTYSTTSPISNSTTPVLYQTERWNSTPLQYQFPVPNGNYSVNLKFAEIYFTQMGQRVFNAAINGTSVLTNFDVVASAGGPNLAVDKAFPVTVTNGQITILLTPVVSNPKISAIEITAQ